MNKIYDARRATDAEMLQMMGQNQWSLTRGDELVVTVRTLEFASAMADVLNEETAPLLARIAELEAALVEARQFVRYTFPLQDPSDIRYGNRDAEILLSKWGMLRSETGEEE